MRNAAWSGLPRGAWKGRPAHHAQAVIGVNGSTAIDAGAARTLGDESSEHDPIESRKSVRRKIEAANRR